MFNMILYIYDYFIPLTKNFQVMTAKTEIKSGRGLSLKVQSCKLYNNKYRIAYVTEP